MNMKRRGFLKYVITTTGISIMPKWANAHPVNKNLKIDALNKKLKFWKDILSEERFRILFEDGTEPPYSSPLNNIKDDGTFVCAACHLPLFEAKTKYDSGTGWPSFYQAIADRIGTKLDLKLIWPRTEYHCIRCQGHQGHVFEDGPQPTGLRYCNNGLALIFIPADAPLPELRG